MPTINSKEMVDQIIKADGHFEGDPRIVKIVKYTNAWGGECYGLIYPQHNPDAYAATEYVRNPVTIWEAK